MKNNLNKINLPNAWLYFDEHFLDQELVKSLFQELYQSLPWEQSSIKLFGKTHLSPRLEAYFSEDNSSYSYSGKKLTIHPFPEQIIMLNQLIKESYDFSFNAVLANLYRDGNDSNGWHADNEAELGRDPVIASLSLGATRRFEIQHQVTKEKHSFYLNHGSLLIMGGEMQHFWKHQIAKTKQVKEARINLTFRKIK